MTNPNNAVGTNGAFGGRTSVNAFNDIMGAFQSRGVLSGWGISPSSGMTVSVGGNGTTRDVAVAQDASGNKTSVNNISGAPILVTLDSAPASNSRYDAIIAYVDKPPMGNATQDNPECCGIIPVTGTAASSPAYPSDATIRSAITSDGASGATAYYAILGYVLVTSGTTSVTSGMITGAGNPMLNGVVGSPQIQDKAVISSKIDYATLISTGSATLNSTYFSSGRCEWVKFGKVVILTVVDANLSTTPPGTAWQTAAITDIPKVSSSTGNVKWHITNFAQGNNLRVLRLATDTGRTAMYFHYTSGVGATSDFNGQLIYISD